MYRTIKHERFAYYMQYVHNLLYKQDTYNILGKFRPEC